MANDNPPVSEHDHARSCNVAIIRGHVHRDALRRDLPGGGVVVQFDVVTTNLGNGAPASVTVPIAWNDPTPTQFGVVVAGAEVVIVGSVRRRFFRVGGATQSRTEVIADTVTPVRRRKQVANALRGAVEHIADAA